MHISKYLVNVFEDSAKHFNISESWEPEDFLLHRGNTINVWMFEWMSYMGTDATGNKNELLTVLV